MTASSASEFVPSEDVSDAGATVVATRAQCNKRKQTTTPAKGMGKEGNTVWESREWSDYSDVEQPRRRFAAYEETPLRRKPAPRPPSENAKAWAKDFQVRVQAMAKHKRTHCQDFGHPNPKCTCAWAVGPRITWPN